MPTLEWSHKPGKSSWTDAEGRRRKLEVYEGKAKPVKHLSSYLQKGWDFSQERKQRIQSEKDLKTIIGALLPVMQEEYLIARKINNFKKH